MIHILSFQDYEIEVASFGAELHSLKKIGVNYLWTKNQPYWQRQAPVLFPIVGKLKANTYVYHNRYYSLPQHGFARDREFELVGQGLNMLLFRLDDTKNSEYPFDYDLFIKYTIDVMGVKTTYIVINKGNTTLPFSIGAHPAFLCPFYNDEKLKAYYFEFDSDIKLSRNVLQDGLLTEIQHEIPLQNHMLAINEELFSDDALVLSGFKSKAVCLKSANYNLKISWEDCTYLGLWKQPNAPFVCIEPWWGVADSISHNHDIERKKGIINLPPGDKKEFWFNISID